MEEPQPSHGTITPAFSAEDLNLVQRAAEHTHQTTSDFVRTAALERAKQVEPRPRLSLEEVMVLVHKAQEVVRLANPTGRDLLQELLDERRAEAARE